MGGRIRNLAIVEALAPSFDLEIITLVHDRKHLTDPGPIVRYGTWRPVLARHRRGPLHRLLGQVSYRAAGRGWERETWFLGRQEVARAVEESLRLRPPAAVHAAYWFTLRRLRERPRPPLWVLDTHDVQFERWRRLRGRVNERERRAEIDELRRNDVVVAITAKDAETFRSILGSSARIETIGMGVDLHYWSREAIGAGPRGASVVYYGSMGGEPNRRAAVHLCTEILPELRAGRAGADVVILGADPARDVRQLADLPGVRVTGTVEDPRLVLASSGVFALSLRAASGIRSRACEAMALMLPIVAYPEALEGMGFEAGRDYLEAHDPRQFAAEIDRVLLDRVLADRLTASARERVASHYGVEATYGRFVGLYRELLAQAGTDPGAQR